MLDTISLQSPFLTEIQAQKIELFCNKFIGVQLETGGLLYEFTRGELTGSYDSRISIQIKREQLVEVYNSLERKQIESTFYDDGKGNLTERKNFKQTGKMTMLPEACEPYLVIECSVHKAMLGHNVFGGPTDFQKSAQWLVKLIQDFAEIELPLALDWLVRRIDKAECFDLGSFEAVQSWVGGMNHCSFPRRKVSKHGLESIYVAGTKTTVKSYHKGPEFSKHDRKRLFKFLSPKVVNDLQISANNTLRIEVEIKSKKLRELFEGRLPCVKEITHDFLDKIYDKEVFKLLREAQDDDVKEIYRTTDSVLNRLNDVYPDQKRLARSLYTTWLNLATNGEDKVKLVMSKPVFYRHRKLLIEANVSWLQTDIILNQQYDLIPKGFKPVMADSRRLREVDPIILELLNKVA